YVRSSQPTATSDRRCGSGAGGLPEPSRSLYAMAGECLSTPAALRLRKGTGLRRGRCPRVSGRDELVPAADHVAVLVHDRVPACDIAHAVPEGAAVAHRARLLHDLALGAQDVALGGLAFNPEAPFVLGHVLLGGLHAGGIVALAV